MAGDTLRRLTEFGFLALAAVFLVSGVTAIATSAQATLETVRDLCCAYLFWYASGEIYLSRAARGERGGETP